MSKAKISYGTLEEEKGGVELLFIKRGKSKNVGGGMEWEREKNPPNTFANAVLHHNMVNIGKSKPPPTQRNFKIHSRFFTDPV